MTSRRQFIKSSTCATLGAFTLPRISIANSGISANSRLNVALIGCGNVAHQAIEGVTGHNIVAIVDVDSKMHLKYQDRHPGLAKAPKYEDFRVMLDKHWQEIDLVCISTPDHTHFPATMDAIQRGLHVNVQKPLAHNIWQARTLRKAAQHYKVHTNMNNQGHAFDGFRTFREWYETDVFGQITEVTCYDKFPRWGTPWFKRPASGELTKDQVPAHLNYDLWLGPVEDRHYSGLFHPQSWRGFYEFGTGTIGDIFCHIADAAVFNLDLYEPVSVEREDVYGEFPGMIPDGVRIRFDFKARGNKAPCTLYWVNGPKAEPDVDGLWTWPGRIPANGAIYKGTKANAYTNMRSSEPRLINKDAMRAFKEAGYPEEKYQRLGDGSGSAPVREIIRVIQGELKEAGSDFEYSAPFTETMLLGLLAVKNGGKIEWDAANCRITNRPELNDQLKEPVRKGWEYGEDLRRA